MPVFVPPRRWALWLLVAYVTLAAALLISPVGPGEIIDAIMTWIHDGLGLRGVRQGWIEAPANVILFAPLGLLLTLVFRRPWLGVVVAVALSAGAELAQIVLPSRTPSTRDVVANVIGAVIGAAIAWAIIAHRRRRARPSATRRAG